MIFRVLWTILWRGLGRKPIPTEAQISTQEEVHLYNWRSLSGKMDSDGGLASLVIVQLWTICTRELLFHLRSRLKPPSSAFRNAFQTHPILHKTYIRPKSTNFAYARWPRGRTRVTADAHEHSTSTDLTHFASLLVLKCASYETSERFLCGSALSAPVAQFVSATPN